MVDDDCWAVRAQATTQREEIQLLRGAVAALRATRGGAACARTEERAHPAATRVTVPMVFAFLLGVVMTSAAIALFGAALCP